MNNCPIGDKIFKRKQIHWFKINYSNSQTQTMSLYTHNKKIFGQEPTKQSTVLIAQLIQWMEDHSKTKPKVLTAKTDVTQTNGIFRESGTFSKIETWIKKFERNTIQPFDENFAMEDVAGIIQQYFHRLPNPLIEFETVKLLYKLSSNF
jgi:hypothetical protein